MPTVCSDTMLERITQWIQIHREEMIRDLFRLVAVPSISDPDSSVKPFGQPCRDALDLAYILAGENGYRSQDYAHTVGRICFSDSPSVSVGIWCHLDVVPVPNPEDWVYPPFQGTELEGRYLVGRGIQDNKMPAVAVLYVFRCLREMGVALQKSWSLYLGTSEENGMDDVRWFVEKETCPDLSLVPDTGFTVCTAQRGCQILEYSIPLPVASLSFQCGSNISVTPEHITARLSGGQVLKAEGHGFHVARADQHNAVRAMLARLSAALPEAADALRRLSRLLESPLSMGIACTDERSGPLFAQPTEMDWKDGRLLVRVYSILPVTSDPDALLEQAVKNAEMNGVSCRRIRLRRPCSFREDHPLIGILTDVYRSVTGDASEPFVMTGGNYASLLPNAVGYGPGMPGREFPPHLFPQGHGDYHQCDESEDWEHIVRFMQVYAMSILKLDSLPDRTLILE